MASLLLLLDWVQNSIVTLLVFLCTCLIITLSLSNDLHCLTDCCGFQWWIQDFTEVGAPTSREGANIWFCQNFPKNCIKFKEFGLPGGRPSRLKSETYLLKEQSLWFIFSLQSFLLPLHDPFTQWAPLLSVQFITALNEVGARLYFHRHL